MCFTSSSLRPLDVEFMKALHEKVNIVPVLAKADTLTPSEVKKKKIKVRCVWLYVRGNGQQTLLFAGFNIQSFVWRSSSQIRDEIEQYGIKIYQFPDCDSDEDEDFKQQDLQLKVNSSKQLQVKCSKQTNK